MFTKSPHIQYELLSEVYIAMNTNLRLVHGQGWIGNVATFPMGKIGEERVALAWDQWQVDRNIITADIQKDVAQVKQAIFAVSAIQTDGLRLALTHPIRTRASIRWMITQRSCTRTSGSILHR